MGSYHLNTIFNHFRNGSNKPEIFRMGIVQKAVIYLK